MSLSVDLIAQTAQEVEMGDPIDWGMLSISEESAYQMMASGLYEQFLNTPVEDRELMLLATATKLVVENFVLNLKMYKPL